MLGNASVLKASDVPNAMSNWILLVDLSEPTRTTHTTSVTNIGDREDAHQILTVTTASVSTELVSATLVGLVLTVPMISTPRSCEEARVIHSRQAMRSAKRIRSALIFMEFV